MTSSSAELIGLNTTLSGASSVHGRRRNILGTMQGNVDLRWFINYKVNDHWQVEAGGNWFIGRHDDTFFGQFERNSNVYTAVRYSF